VRFIALLMFYVLLYIVYLLLKRILMHYLDLINILKQRREELGITQVELASLSGVALRTVKQIEGGESNPTMATLLKLADVLGMELKMEVKKRI
jgi:DNA-binding XRE family transcriptional regulator